ncbi:MAG: undecaprenyl-diphosphate phosphatase [Spirochaetaceae bacterium]|nr:undecaprenyl-diphosphate phosphatase [Spirochaetaceae bacterium]HPG26700.1 undecaprenyl-diphosphate phosphatase [Myxococcota bacterium]
MDAIEAALLGLAQGLTEFFPVSSSGHLAMLQALFGGREAGGLLFEVAVHVATLVAIAFFYRARIAELVLGVLRGEREAIEYGAKLAVGTLPAVVVGLSAKDWIGEQFSNPVLVGIALLVTGCIVYSTRWTAPRADAPAPSWPAVIGIGLAQSFAILPGISRSGSTVAAALALGVAPRAAAEFSFLLGIIAISGAAVLMLPELSEAGAEALVDIGVGGVAALASGLLAIWLFVRMLDRSVFHLWAFYCWAVGAAFLTWSLA